MSLQTLLLMRHAKSSWSDAELTDHQRPLNGRGKKAATAVGAALTARGYPPELIWSSDSTRTRQTAMRLIRAIPGAQMVNYIPEFYHGSAEEVFRYAAKTGEPDVKALMLLGHNPGWSELYQIFTGQFHAFPTAACCVLKRIGDGDWLDPENWRAVDMIIPRDLVVRELDIEDTD